MVKTDPPAKVASNDQLGHAAPERDTWGPAGTYGCACVSRDARNCTLMRYGWCGNFGRADEACECMCHQWREDDED